MATAVAARAGPLPRLTAEDVARFYREGFLVIPELTTPEDAADIRRTLSGLYARFKQLPRTQALDLGDEARPETPQIPEINWTLRLVPRLRLTLAFARCREIAAQLFGGRADHTGYDHAILKPPRNGHATPWHQDQAFTEDRGPFCSVHFWIALQPVTVEMGCMQFIPGSHLSPLLPHRPVSKHAHAMRADGADVSTAVACPLPAGGATVHLPRTLHATGPNLTDEYRFAWGLEFGPPLPPPPRWRAWLQSLRRLD
jgi:hypothetical protein